MKVYHGSDILIDEIDLSKAKPRKDFGQGFYVTSIEQQAKDMARRIAEWHGTQSIVTEFDFDEFAYNDDNLQVLRFVEYSEKWLDFVLLNRNNRLSKQAHNYDIVEGPVADDAVTTRINDYLAGVVSKVDFLEELKFYKYTHQICFCTVKSLQMLNYIDNKAEIYIYHIDDEIIRKLMIDNNLTDIEAGKLYFNSKTYSKLTDKDTKLYKKLWTEIYKLLLNELNAKLR